jgi:hypothetical protein
MAIDLRREEGISGVTRQEQSGTPTVPTDPGGESSMPMMTEGTAGADGGASRENPEKPSVPGSGLPEGPAAPLPPMPSVPPPPPAAQFNIAGSGGGEGASSFARPGSAAARPFRSADFFRSRLAGGGPTDIGRRVGFGSGAAMVGGAAPSSSFAQGAFGDAAPNPSSSDDELARMMAQIAGRYQGGM